MSKKIFPIIAFILPFVVYMITIVPGITFTDSGELMGAASTFGIPHPTGYPLFVLIAKIWSLIPLPIEAPLQFNILSVICVALSSLLFYFSATTILLYLKANKNLNISESTLPLVSLVFALIYSFTGTIWNEALAFEVYPLQNLMINLVILLAMKAVLSDYDIKKYMAVTFALGLAFANHMTSILMVPALLFLFFKRPGSKYGAVASPKSMIFIFLPLIFGAAIYAILPIRSSMSPEFDWGGVSRGFDKFWYHVSGKQYQVWMFSGVDAFKENLGEFFGKLLKEYAYIGFIPTLLGFWFAKKSSKTLLAFFTILALTCILYASNYDIHDIDAYYSLAYVAFAFIGLFSIPYLLTLMKSNNAVYVLLMIPALMLGLNFSANDRSGEIFVPEYTNNLVNNLDQNAIIISSQWDYWCSAFWYMQKVDGVRPDLILIEKELLRRTWYLKQLQRWYPKQMAKHKAEFDSFLEQLELFESGKAYNPRQIQSRFETLLRSFIDKNIDERPIYITADIMQTEPYLGQDLEKIPQGFALRLEQKHQPYSVSDKTIDISKIAANASKSPEHLEQGIKQSAAVQLVYLARYAALQNDNITAKSAYSKALQLIPNDNGIKNEMTKLK